LGIRARLGRIIPKQILRAEHQPLKPKSPARESAISLGAGLFTGFVAGLVGLGGAELRIPFLLYTIGVPVREMVALNLIVSLVTSGSNFLVRWQSGLFAPEDMPLSLSMVAGSLFGGYFGAVISHRVSIKRLKIFLAAILAIVIARILFEMVAENDPTRVFPSFELPLAAVFGFLVGLVAGATGVAGGEYRIPILMYLFGYPIKIAGTISQLVSIPTIAISASKHNSYGVIGKRTIRIALIMGIGSLLGVLLSGIFLLQIPDIYINSIFIIILSYTVFKLLRDLR